MVTDGRGCLPTPIPKRPFATSVPWFNGGVAGEVLLRMAAGDASCEGILVNSATQEISLIISRPTAQSLISQSATEAPDHQH